MSYAYSWPQVGEYQSIWIDDAEVYGKITRIGPVVSYLETEDGLTAMFTTAELSEWAEACPGWLESITQDGPGSDPRELPSSDTCPIHGAGCEAWA